MNRCGWASVSMRLKETLSGLASAFFETNNRPRRVATQSVEVSLGARSPAARYDPPLLPELLVRLAPIGSKSPHVMSPVYFGTPPGDAQFASRSAWSPP